MRFERKNVAIALLMLVFSVVTSVVIQDFVPLSCNSNMTACVSWTQIFGTAAEFPFRVIIDCGTCITMDYPGTELMLAAGIDVRGKLVFPDGYALTLRTAMITVQGELDMTASKAVDGTPMIHIIMIGSDTNQTFTPVGENAAACVQDSFFGNCKVGKKAITVAGGKVNCTYWWILSTSDRRQLHTLTRVAALPLFWCSAWLAFGHSHLGPTLRCSRWYGQQSLEYPCGCLGSRQVGRRRRDSPYGAYSRLVRPPSSNYYGRFCCCSTRLCAAESQLDDPPTDYDGGKYRLCCRGRTPFTKYCF